MCTRENQASFWPNKSCTLQVFALQRNKNIITPLGSWLPSPSIWKQRSNLTVSKFCSPAFHWWMWQSNSSHIIKLCIQALEADFVLTTTPHPSSPREVMFVRDTPSVFSLQLCDWYDNVTHTYPQVRLGLLLFAHAGNCLIESMTKTLCYRVKTQWSFRFLSIV